MSDQPEKNGMKRSQALKLTLMAGSAMALGACSDKRQEAQTYNSLDACETAGLYSATECQTAYNKAVATHQKSAPRYNSEQLCQQDFKARCEERSDGGRSFWSPFMTGFLVSQLLDQGRGGYYYGPYYNRFGSRPGFYTVDGSRINIQRSKSGKYRSSIRTRSVKARPKRARVMTRTSVVSRGGFGRRGRSGG